MTHTSNGTSLSQNFIRLAHPARTPGVIHDYWEHDDFIPGHPDITTPHVKGHTDLSQETSRDLGSEMSFSWNYNSAHSLYDCELMIHFDQIAAGGGGLDPRYLDDPIYHIVEECYWEVNGRRMETLHGDKMHFDQLLMEGDELLARHYALQRAGLTVAQRTAIATAPGGFWAIARIPFFFTRNLQHALPAWALSHDIRFIFRLRPAAFVLQDTNGIAPTSVTGSFVCSDSMLRMSVATTAPGQRTHMISKLTQGMNEFGYRGVTYAVTNEAKTLNNAVAAADTVQRIDLTQVTHTCFRGFHITRPVLNLVANYALNDRWVLTPIDRRYMEVDGTRLLPEHQSDYLIHVENGNYYSGRTGPAVYTFQFSPTLRGGIELGSTNQARLIITWAAAVGADQMTDVYGEMHNFMSLVMSPANKSVTVEMAHSNVA